ncbi:MAG: biopolymer transporter ExbD [Halobacteriovoraceae bacterium]|nr:biopolymer transporter ExbD [Halobacteriovoraceae bacterium]
MARNRAIRKKKFKRKRKEFVEMDITSLLDILVILLVFLLKSYNASNIVINVQKDIALPKSESISPNNAGVIIQLSKDKIWVDAKEVIDYANNPKQVKIYDHGGRLVLPLYDELVRIREEIELTNKQANIDKNFSGVANLVVDKEIKYLEVKRILYTTAEAGFKSYKFVVMGEEQY